MANKRPAPSMKTRFGLRGKRHESAESPAMEMMEEKAMSKMMSKMMPKSPSGRMH